MNECDHHDGVEAVYCDYLTFQEEEVSQPAYPERRHQKQKASDWRQYGAHPSVHTPTLW